MDARGATWLFSGAVRNPSPCARGEEACGVEKARSDMDRESGPDGRSV